MSLHRLSKHCCGSDGCVASAAGESRMKPMYRLEEHAAGAVSVVCDTDASAVTLLTEIERDKVKTPTGHERQSTDRSVKRDWKSVVWGKSVSVRVDLGGSSIFQKKKKK